MDGYEECAYFNRSNGLSNTFNQLMKVIRSGFPGEKPERIFF
jgi:hypothetical protein